MKNSIFSKILAYTICLQLTVGTYPSLNRKAYAQDENTPTSTDESNISRGPASEDLKIDANEWFDNFKTRMDVLEKYCTKGQKQIAADFAVMDADSIGNDGRIHNCDALADSLKQDLQVADDIYTEMELAKEKSKDCVDCVSPEKMTLQDVENRKAERENPCQDPPVSLAEQEKFAKEDCSWDCKAFGIFHLQSSSCPASSGSSPVCFSKLLKGIWDGIVQTVMWLPTLVWDGIKLGYKKLFGKSESLSAEKAHALAGLSNKQLDDIYKLAKADPKKVEEAFLTKAGRAFKEFGQAIIGYPGYAEKAQCVNCGGKADLVCGAIGESSGFLISMFGNGLVFGALKGWGTKLAARMSKFGKFAKETKVGKAVVSKTAESYEKVARFTKATGNVLSKTWVGKGLIATGRFFVTNASKLSKKTGDWWKAFKGKPDGLYAALSKYKSIVTADKTTFKAARKAANIPGKISLTVGRGVTKTFEAIGRYEDWTYRGGLRVTNSKLYEMTKRAGNINKIRAAKNLADKVSDETRMEKINRLHNEGKTEEAADLALHKVNKLTVAKDLSKARSPEEWLEVKKKIVSNNVRDLKLKHLDGSELADDVDFTLGKTNKTIWVNTQKELKEVKITNPKEIESVRVYGADDQYAIIKKTDGSYVIHDMNAKSHIAQIPKEKAEFVDALMGKKTPLYEDLPGKAFDQVKTNLKINGVRYTEELTQDGNKVLKIETPKGCQPNVVHFNAAGFAI